MNWPSGRVRDTFIKYFVRHSQYPHTFVPSSSIIPRNDPSLAFTNAGMNQFKDIILGYGRPEVPRATNSQKCLRINDLQLVGTDTYHHTFFEMLGNWSFSNYFKKEACAMAWDLMTNVYGLDPDRLYVTYFAGSDGVPADKEVQEIWRKIGVPESRILPFVSENFWSMGPVGPCGPSTEIHYDHRGVASDPSLVNKDNGMVVELWNLVFMQYNRLPNSKLERLPLSHVVDTGAGLERLTAVLNGKVSNYDTDLFLPIFDALSEISKKPKYTGSFETELDLCYRILGDHMRAAAVALADGVLPQSNHKIRRLVQRSLSIAQSKFVPTNSLAAYVDLLEAVLNAISETLSGAYPEVAKSKGETLAILTTEARRYLEILEQQSKSKVKSKCIPTLVAANYPSLTRLPEAEIEKVKAAGCVDGKTAFFWYESHGVTQEALEELCVSLGLAFNPADFKTEMDKVKKVFRDEVARQTMHDEEKIFVRKIESLLSLYNPLSSGGIYREACEASEVNPLIIEWVFDEDGDPVEEISSDHSYWIVMNETPFFPGNESVQSDAGNIKLENDSVLVVNQVKRLPSGWILHHVENAPELGFRRKSKIIDAALDNEVKFGRHLSMQALRNLKSYFKQKYGIVRFGDEKISDKEIQLQVTILRGDFQSAEISECQDTLNEYASPIVVTKRTLNKNNEYEITCATGLAAEVAMRCGWEISKCVSELQLLLKKCERNFESNKKSLQELNDEVKYCLKEGNLIGNIQLPYEISVMAKDTLVQVDKALVKHELNLELSQLVAQMAEAASEPFVIKAFKSDAEISSLKKLTKPAEKKPVLVIVYSSNGDIQGRCCCPKELVSEEFDAEKWMQNVSSVLENVTVAPPKSQDPKLQTLIKKTRLDDEDLEAKLAVGLEKAKIMVESLDLSSSTESVAMRSSQSAGSSEKSSVT